MLDRWIKRGVYATPRTREKWRADRDRKDLQRRETRHTLKGVAPP